MKILVINAGSSTLKFQLLDTKSEEVIAKGNVERIGEGASFVAYKANGKSLKFEQDIKNHDQAVDFVLNTLTSAEYGVLSSINEVNAFGHRVVNAGDKYFDPILVDEAVLEDFKTKTDFSPLHMPGAIAGLSACMSIAKDIPNVAVFDVGFHKTLPDYAYRYAISNKYYDEYKIRRYGAHGTSHFYVANKTAEVLGKDVSELKIVSCHLGSGASICAVKNGQSVDTSMGFTPLEGIMMNTRSGDIDASVVEFLCKKTGKSVSEIIREFNKESGIYAINDGVFDILRAC